MLRQNKLHKNINTNDTTQLEEPEIGLFDIANSQTRIMKNMGIL